MMNQEYYDQHGMDEELVVHEAAQQSGGTSHHVIQNSYF